MKPEKLTISAWGVYPNKEQIDFTKYTDGMFLILGVTGSGKTTIFDAICYAIYGKVSGEMRSNDSLRSDFVVDDKIETFVELEFVHKEHRYYIKRNPKYSKLRKNKLKRFDKKEGAELIIDFKTENPKVISVLKEVNLKLNEIMGISYEQFKQVSMIAQGEFQKLLFAKANDKLDVFRNIFGTHLYQKLQKNVLEKARNIEREVDIINSNIEEVINSYLINENITFNNLKDYKDIATILNQRILEQDLKIEAESQNRSNIENKIDNIKDIINRGEFNNRLLSELELEKNLKVELNNLKSEIELAKLELSAINLSKELSVKENNYKKSKFKLEQYENEYNALNNQQEEFFLKFEDIKIKLQNLENKSSENKENYIKKNELIEILKDLKEFNSLNLILTENKNLKDKKQIEFDNNKKIIDDLKTEIKNLKLSLNDFDGIEEELINLKNDLNLKNNQKQLCEVIEQDKIKLNNKENELADLRKDYLKASQIKKETLKNFEESDKLYKDNIIGIVAFKYLKDNMPCPVCGSKIHPKVANFSYKIPDEKELEKLKEKKELAELKLNEIVSKGKILNNEKQIILDNLSENKLKVCGDLDFDEFEQVLYNDINNINNLIKNLELKLNKRKELNNLIETKENNLENLQKEFGLINEELSKINNICIEFETKCNEKLYKIGNLKNEEILKNNIFNIEKQINDYEEDLKITKQKYEDLNNNINKNNALIKKLSNDIAVEKIQKQELKNIFEEELKLNFNNDYDKYELSKNSIDDISKLQFKIEAYNTKVSLNENNIISLLEKTKNIKEVNIDEEKQQLKNLELELKEINTNIDKLKSEQVIFEKSHKSISDNLNKISNLEKDYAIIGDLSKAFNGKNKLNIELEAFILSQYFEDILKLANIRLLKMSNNQYELLKVEEVLDGRKKDFLEICVMDNYTGKKRSVTSLSGGETFKASLALALAVSDIIQQSNGGIVVDVLFIDEGFSTLDIDSMNQAIDTLIDLKNNSGILIGIISHITEIRERIDNKIIIEKTNSGSKIKNYNA